MTSLSCSPSQHSRSCESDACASESGHKDPSGSGQGKPHIPDDDDLTLDLFGDLPDTGDAPVCPRLNSEHLRMLPPPTGPLMQKPGKGGSDSSVSLGLESLDLDKEMELLISEEAPVDDVCSEAASRASHRVHRHHHGHHVHDMSIGLWPT